MVSMGSIMGIIVIIFVADVVVVVDLLLLHQ